MASGLMQVTEELSIRDLRRQRIAEVNRARLVTAAIDVLGEDGYEALSVASVIKRACLSRKTFYEVFADRHDCFEAVVAHISGRGLTALSAACATQQGWLAATRSGLNALLALIEDEPILARIWFVESLAGHPGVLDQRARTMSKMAAAIHRGSAVLSGERRPPHLVAEVVVGGISNVIHDRLVSASEEPLSDLAGSFMYLIVLPYLGHARARAESRRAPARLARQETPARRPRLNESLRDSKIRLTYRTIRTLAAICDRPGASNVEASVRCGIRDQGQISKLLSRLEGLGLIENRGFGRTLGGANAWYITDRGADLVGALRAPEAAAVF